MIKNLLLIGLALILNQSFAQTSWETIFVDDFNRPDGEMGGNYNSQAVNGTLLIKNNEVAATTDETSTMYWAATYLTSVNDDSLRLSIDFTSTNGASGSEIKYALMAKGGGSSEWSYGAGVDAINGQVAISKYDQSGNQDLLIGDSFNIEPDSVYHLEFIVMQGELELTVTEIFSGNQITLNYTDLAPLDGNQVSINGIQEVYEIVKFDNFQIDTVAPSTNINEIEKSFGVVALYPNPAKETLNVTIENNDNCIIQIFDIEGKKVHELKLESSCANSICIPIEKLSKGVYAVQISTETALKMLKFVKE